MRAREWQAAVEEEIRLMTHEQEQVIQQATFQIDKIQAEAEAKANAIREARNRLKDLLVRATSTPDDDDENGNGVG